MTTTCRVCRADLDARTLTAGGEVCHDCASGPEQQTSSAAPCSVQACTTPATRSNGRAFYCDQHAPTDAASYVMQPACKYCGRDTLQWPSVCDQCAQFERNADGTIRPKPATRHHDTGCTGTADCQQYLPCACWCHEPEL